ISPLSGLQLAWQPGAPDFTGGLRVDVSDDLGTWRTVVPSAPVVNLHSGGSELVQGRLEFASTKGKFYRLSWDSKPAPFEVHSVTAIETPAAPIVEQSRISAPGTPVAGHPNERTFDLGGRFPLTQITLELPET